MKQKLCSNFNFEANLSKSKNKKMIFAGVKNTLAIIKFN